MYTSLLSGLLLISAAAAVPADLVKREGKLTCINNSPYIEMMYAPFARDDAIKLINEFCAFNHLVVPRERDMFYHDQPPNTIGRSVGGIYQKEGTLVV